MGTILIITGATKYDFKQFLGLSQILRKNTCHSIGTDCELNMSGVLGLVRHPWYSAVMMLLWARDLDPVAILVNTILTVYIIIGTFLEEKKLLIEFGQPYRDYQSKVSMFLPIKWFKSTLNKG
jgi:protein-S-isoprenylcysteine O-methyltransferase Ste14